MPKSLAEIARIANVSSATASRVVNNHPRVGKETRQRVLSVIATYGFEPNAAAKALASSRSGAIGVVVPVDASALQQNPWVAEVVRGLADQARRQDIALMLILESVLSQDRVNKIITNFVGCRRVDGLVIANSLEGDLLTPRLSELGFPHAMIGAPVSSAGSFVDVRNHDMAREVTTHMINHGWKRFALISGPEYMTVSQNREHGFFEAIDAAGLDRDQVQVITAEFTSPTIEATLTQILDSPNAPDAFIAMSDVIATEVLHAALKLGLEAGKDFGIAAFDDLLGRSNSVWGLTTMAQPVYEMGQRALELVTNQLDEGQPVNGQAWFDGNLIIRTSCGCSPVHPVTLSSSADLVAAQSGQPIQQSAYSGG